MAWVQNGDCDSVAVPVNASPRILFGSTVNPLTVNAQSAVVLIGGHAVNTQVGHPTNSQEIILTPVQSLPANTSVTVRLSGLEDMAGRRIPDYSWTFTTGTGCTR